jgi:Family of unknown function (DUF6763)
MPGTEDAFPIIGQWFRRPNGTLLEVVAVDEEANTVEIQLFDGTIDEVDLDAWAEQFLVEVSAPEDWSGSVDMDPEDYVGDKPDDMPRGFHDPLEFLDREN